MNSNNKIKNVGLIETNEAYQKVLYWFFSFPYKKVGLNELVKQLKISKTTANKIVNKLVNKGFLKKEIIGKSWRIYCNTMHVYNKSRKISYNLAMVYESGIIEEINKKFSNSKSIVLFGSYRKGDDTGESDIDIAVEISGNQPLKIERLLVLNKFGYRKNVSVNLHMFSRNQININLFSNIVNGIILDGFLEVRK